MLVTEIKLINRSINQLIDQITLEHKQTSESLEEMTIVIIMFLIKAK